MGLRTREQYLASLRSLRPNVYRQGKLVRDVTSDPATRRTVESHARAFDSAQDPDLADLFTTPHESGNRIHRFTSLMRSPADVVANLRLKRQMYRLTGTCTGAICVGWNAANTLWAVTSEVDGPYHDRLRTWLRHVQDNGLTVAGALTDAKGDRSKPPSAQPDPDSNVHIVDRVRGGVVVRGCKAMIAGVAAAEEIVVMPGSALREPDAAWAVAFAIPRDTERVLVIETRRPSDGRDYEEGFDQLTTGISQAYVIFQDVFVPEERVFLAGEYQATANLIRYFTANYRACIGGCVSGQGDVMIGAAVLMARANGLSARVFTDKLVQMAINNESTFGMGAGAITLGQQHPSGVWVADSLLSHTNKVLVATLPYETKRLCQEIGGGIVETGCFPAWADFAHPEYGDLVQRYVAGATEPETRARAARLAEWLTIGSGVPGCMHGGGSPDGARLVVRASTPIEEYVEYARRLAGISQAPPEPTPKK